jgi:hypothetical protein
MQQKVTRITCPNCGQEINVEDVLAHDIEEQTRGRLEKEIGERVRTEIEGKKNREIAELSRELQESRQRTTQLQESQIAYEKLKRRFEHMERDYQLKMEQELTLRQQEMEESITERESRRLSLKLLEKDQKLDSLTKQLEEMRKRAEQGSVQLQGEAQEVAIERMLSELFPRDHVREVPKGRQGADAVHLVYTDSGENCGTIIYESKRTKNFGKDWIEKLKRDQMNEKADLAVLVTETLPQGIDQTALMNGVWVCSFSGFKSLAMVLRDSLIRIHALRKSQTHKGDKMTMLYDYLTSQEFKLQLESIIEGFTSLKGSIDRERRAMEKLWKERKKQLEKVLLSTTHFYGSIKGIAGSSVPQIPMLELDGGEKEDLEK